VKLSLHKLIKRRRRKVAGDKDLRAETAKHRGRVFRGGLILSTAWMASSYWTLNGFMIAAVETSTASFTGAVQALLAAVVASVVVAGCCALLLAFSGSGDDHE